MGTGAIVVIVRTIIVMALFEFAILLSAYAELPRPNKWDVLYSKNGITIERGSVVGSAYKAFRGTGTVEARIAEVISILFDHTHANKWVHNLVESVELRPKGKNGIVVWQHFDNPWPIEDRDFIFRAEPTYNKTKDSFWVRFRDIDNLSLSLTPAEQSMIPDKSCCIRGKLIYSEWQFRAIGPQSTCVRVEVILDPRGLVPAFFVNQFQTNWPYLTIKGLRRQAQKEVNFHEVSGEGISYRPETAINPAQCKQGHLID